MRAAWRVLGLALVFVAASAGVARAADDEAKKKEAQGYFDEGLRLAKNDPRGAVVAFREAYARYPSFRVLYNIGQLCGRLGDVGCSVRAYERYLREGGDEVPAKRRKEVEAEVKQLSRTLGRVTVTVSVADADVVLDDEPVGRSPLAAPLAVSGGEHRIVATTGDGAKAEKRFALVAAGTASVELTLEAPPPPPAPKEPEPAKAPEPKVAPATEAAPFPVVAWAVTGGLAVATGVTGILAAGAWGDYKDTRATYPITREELDSAHGSARDMFLVATAFGVATVVSAGVATYFTFGGKSPEGTPGEKKRASASPRRVALVPTAGGVVLVGGLP